MDNYYCVESGEIKDCPKEFTCDECDFGLGFHVNKDRVCINCWFCKDDNSILSWKARNSSIKKQLKEKELNNYKSMAYFNHPKLE